MAARLRRVDNRRMAYVRSLFGAFCDDEDDVEARCLVFYSLWIGNDFIAADHGTRSRADVLRLALRRLEADYVTPAPGGWRTIHAGREHFDEQHTRRYDAKTRARSRRSPCCSSSASWTPDPPSSTSAPAPGSSRSPLPRSAGAWSQSTCRR